MIKLFVLSISVLAMTLLTIASVVFTSSATEDQLRFFTLFAIGAVAYPLFKHLSQRLYNTAISLRKVTKSYSYNIKLFEDKDMANMYFKHLNHKYVALLYTESVGGDNNWYLYNKDGELIAMFAYERSLDDFLTTL